MADIGSATQGEEKKYDQLIRAVSVGSEQPVFLESLSRWDYLKKYLPDFQEMIDFDVKRMVLWAVGVILLLMGNILAIVALAGAAYFQIQYEHRRGQVGSQRRVIVGN